MTYDFPTDPNKRRIVLVLDEHSIERCSYEGETQVFRDSEVYVLNPSPSNHEGRPKAHQNIIHSGLAQNGKILIQSPYNPDHYEDAVHATQRFSLEKHMHLSVLCMQLGAKKLSVKQVEIKSITGSAVFNAKGETLGANGGLKATYNEFDKVCSEMSLTDEFTGGQPDVDGAEQYLRERKLLSDPSMRALLELRRSSSNKLMSRRISVNLSSETKNNLQIISRLKIPSIIELKANYEKINEERRDYNLTVEVDFQ